jgi:hypothetical protein
MIQSKKINIIQQKAQLKSTIQTPSQLDISKRLFMFPMSCKSVLVIGLQEINPY